MIYGIFDACMHALFPHSMTSINSLGKRANNLYKNHWVSVPPANYSGTMTPVATQI